MFTRIVSFTGAKDIDAGIAYVRDTVAPVLHQQKGFRGTTASADRAGKVFSVLSLWDTAADREASESALLKVREEGQKIIGGQLTVELFEAGVATFSLEIPDVGSFELPAPLDNVPRLRELSNRTSSTTGMAATRIVSAARR